MSASVTIRLDKEDKLEALDRLASAMDRSRNWVINRALDRYIAEQAWQIEEIQKAIAEADRGEFATDEEVDAVARKFGARWNG
jgi:predicted transcriptional regulator